jgi:hypothetical protein
MLTVFYAWLCRQRLQDDPTFKMVKKDFVGVFRVAWETTMTPANLIAGFRKADIAPLDRSKLVENPEIFLPGQVLEREERLAEEVEKSDGEEETNEEDAGEEAAFHSRS